MEKNEVKVSRNLFFQVKESIAIVVITEADV